MPNLSRLRWLTCRAISLCLLLTLSTNVLAWGASGHRIIAMIAERNLTPKTSQQIKALLGNETLPSASTWADLIRVTKPETAPWHFVDIASGAKSYDPQRDCPNGDCAIARLEFYKTVLANPKETKENRLEALKFIIHLVGDIHQPLHCNNNQNDDYGNRVKVRLPSESYTSKARKQQSLSIVTNLHRIWDSELIYQTDTPDAEFADDIVLSMKPATLQAYQAGSPETWALEAHDLAPLAYSFPNDAEKQLDIEYYTKTFSIINTQLGRAGVRLAKFLNDIFDKPVGTDEGDPAHHKESAAEIVRRLVAGDYNGISAEFSPSALYSQTPKQLAEDWNTTVKLYGNYVSTEDVNFSRVRTGYDIVSIRCRMQKGFVDIVVLYGSDGKISYLAIRPSK